MSIRLLMRGLEREGLAIPAPPEPATDGDDGATTAGGRAVRGYTERARGSGETGRHAGFRFLCFRACGFKSRLPHDHRSVRLTATRPRARLDACGPRPPFSPFSRDPPIT